VVVRLITPLRMSYEESYAKAFPFNKMVPGMLDPEMIEDTAKIVKEATKDKIQVNLIINKRAGGPPAARSEDLPDTLFREEAEGVKVLLDILDTFYGSKIRINYLCLLSPFFNQSDVRSEIASSVN